MSLVRKPRDLSRMDLCFIDVETTGPVFGFHEVIEIGVIRVDQASLLQKSSWITRIRPEWPERITDHARKLNGYSPESWKAAPAPSAELWNSFCSFVTGAVPVCHNPSFDRAFITLAAKDFGIHELGLDYHWIGTESLAWPLYVGGQLPEMSLNALCDLFQIPREPLPHNALSGAAACHFVYRQLISLLKLTNPSIIERFVEITAVGGKSDDF